MSKLIYDSKGRHIGYESKSHPSGETVIVRPQNLTNKVNDDDGKAAYERIWRNKTKGR